MFSPVSPTAESVILPNETVARAQISIYDREIFWDFPKSLHLVTTTQQRTYRLTMFTDVCDRKRRPFTDRTICAQNFCFGRSRNHDGIKIEYRRNTQRTHVAGNHLQFIRVGCRKTCGIATRSFCKKILKYGILGCRKSRLPTIREGKFVIDQCIIRT